MAKKRSSLHFLYFSATVILRKLRERFVGADDDVVESLDALIDIVKSKTLDLLN